MRGLRAPSITLGPQSGTRNRINAKQRRNVT